MMKKIIVFVLCGVMAVLSFSGCGQNRSENDGSAESETSGNEKVSDASSLPGTDKEVSILKDTDEITEKMFDEYFSSLMLMSTDELKESFSKKSEDEMLTQLYISIKSGLRPKDPKCIHKENGVFYFVFAYGPKGEQHIGALPLVIEEGSVKGLMNDEVYEKIGVLMEEMKCPVCKGTGKTEDGLSECKKCSGLGCIY